MCSSQTKDAGCARATQGIEILRIAGGVFLTPAINVARNVYQMHVPLQTRQCCIFKDDFL